MTAFSVIYLSSQDMPFCYFYGVIAIVAMPLLWRSSSMADANRKILCIEDDRETAGLIAEELVDRGFAVDVAYSGQEGLMAIMRSTPDLVLCDFSMPTMTGLEVLERLNEIAPRFGRIPF